jgi:hypothetical protein
MENKLGAAAPLRAPKPDGNKVGWCGLAAQAKSHHLMMVLVVPSSRCGATLQNADSCMSAWLASRIDTNHSANQPLGHLCMG